MMNNTISCAVHEESNLAHDLEEALPAVKQLVTCVGEPAQVDLHDTTEERAINRQWPSIDRH